MNQMEQMEQNPGTLPSLRVDGLSGLTVDWIRHEVEDRNAAGAPIYPVTGIGSIYGDPDTLLLLAEALDSRADWLEVNDIHPASACRRMRRDTDKIRRLAESVRHDHTCDRCGVLAYVDAVLPIGGGAPVMFCGWCAVYAGGEI